MFKKIWNYIFNVKPAKDGEVEKLTIRERFAALKNLPLFFKLVWQTSPRLTFFNGFLRLIQSFLPLGLLYTGKLIIDQVVLLTRAGNENLPHTLLWRLIALEFGLVILMTALSRAIILIDNLLGEMLTYRTSIRIMTHAATLDLDQFEDSDFYDKLERARQQTSGRAALLSQVFSQFQDFITVGFLAGGLVFFNPWLIFVLLISIIPSFIGEAYFNAKNYSLIRSQTQGRREMEYISFMGSSDESAKEVRLFDLSDFFIRRFRKIAERFFAATKNLELRRSVVGTILALPGSIGYYIAFVFIIQGVLVGTTSIGGLTFLIG
ncbi:MAG: ABC transporter ATP-binding protein, partial [Ferruginibacter sp.]